MYLVRHRPLVSPPRILPRLGAIGDITPNPPGQAPPSPWSNLWDDIKGIFNGQALAADYYYFSSPDGPIEPGDYGQQIISAFTGNPTKQEMQQAAQGSIYLGPNAPVGNAALQLQVNSADQFLADAYNDPSGLGGLGLPGTSPNTTVLLVLAAVIGVAAVIGAVK
jgi:hypothetical protein